MGLLRMGLLLRLRSAPFSASYLCAGLQPFPDSFLLQTQGEASTIRSRVWDILLPVSRHSGYAAGHIMDCPGLLDLICKTAVGEAKGVALLRALCQASRRIAEALDNDGSVNLLTRKTFLRPASVRDIYSFF